MTIARGDKRVPTSGRAMLDALLKMRVSMFDYKPALTAAGEFMNQIIDLQEDHENRLDAIEAKLEGVAAVIDETETGV